MSYRPHCLGVLPLALVVFTSGSPASQAGAADPNFPDRYGIGATFVQADSLSPIIVAECVPGGPAEQAGLLAGDTLRALDGFATDGWSIPRLIDSLLIGEPKPAGITVLRERRELSFLVQRERLADIFARVDLKIAPSRRGSFMVVPLDEAPALRPGEALDERLVRTPDCAEGRWRAHGSPSIVYFWASWCSPCKHFMKWTRENEQTAARSGLRFIGINVDRDCETFAKAVREFAPPGEQYWNDGWHGGLSQAFRAYLRGIPCGALVDPDGKILQITTGSDSLIALAKAQLQ